MIIDEILKKTIVEYDDEGYIKCIPLNEYEFQTYPIELGARYAKLTEDQFVGLHLRVYQFNQALDDIVPYDVERHKAFVLAKRQAMMKEQTDGSEIRQ